MTRLRLLATMGLAVAATVFSGSALAGTRTYVALAGRDDAKPKLGTPGIAMRVDAADANHAAFVTGELARELAEQVHTRRLATDEAGDYALEITLETPRVHGPLAAVPFEAVLRSARGELLWRIEGRSDVEGAPVDASVFAGIGRNVVSALIHDGWVQPRFDPDNPPPQPPRVRIDDSGR